MNLGLLALIVYPIWFGAMAVLIELKEPSNGDGGWVEAGVFYFVVLVPQLLVGGIVQQVIVWAVPPAWNGGLRRVTAAIATLVIPGVLLLLGGEPRLLFAPISLIPMLMGLMVYAMLQRLPSTEHT